MREGYILRNRHGFPDVVHLFGSDLLPAYELALIDIANSNTVPFIPKIGCLLK